MKCVICKTGELRKGKVVFVSERGKDILIVKDVPAEICDQCGERYFSEAVTDRILELANKAFENNIELQVMHYAA